MERSREGFPDVFELILDGNLAGVRYHFRIIGRNGNQSSAACGGVNETRQEDQRTDNEQH